MSTTVCGCLNGLINDEPYMPRATSAQQATALMELAEQDGERLGPEERRLVLEFAEAVRDSRSIMDLVFELAENEYELQKGCVDPLMEDYIMRGIAAALAGEPALALAV